MDGVKILEVTTYYNYFCLKFDGPSFFGTEKKIKPCPVCGETKDVVCRFERKEG